MGVAEDGDFYFGAGGAFDFFGDGGEVLAGDVFVVDFGDDVGGFEAGFFGGGVFDWADDDDVVGDFFDGDADAFEFVAEVLKEAFGGVGFFEDAVGVVDDFEEALDCAIFEGFFVNLVFVEVVAVDGVPDIVKNGVVGGFFFGCGGYFDRLIFFFVAVVLDLVKVISGFSFSNIGEGGEVFGSVFVDDAKFGGSESGFGGVGFGSDIFEGEFCGVKEEFLADAEGLEHFF